MEKKKKKKKKKFRIPPIVLVILAVIIMGVCIGISVNVNNASKEARDFRMQASEAEAEILTKTAYTIGTDEDFVIHYVFDIAFSTDMNDDVKNFTTTIDETDQSLRTLEPGDIISIYYIGVTSKERKMVKSRSVTSPFRTSYFICWIRSFIFLASDL